MASAQKYSLFFRYLGLCYIGGVAVNSIETATSDRATAFSFGRLFSSLVRGRILEQSTTNQAEGTMHNQSELRKAEAANNARYVGDSDYRRQPRILLLTPVAPAAELEGPFRLEGQEFLSSSTIVDAIHCTGAPRSIRDLSEAAEAAPFVVEKVKWAEQEGYDAVIINCMLDPGLKDAKAAVNIPVIGIREATTAVALLVGSNPAYIYPDDIAILDLAKDPEKTFTDLVEKGRMKIRNQGADVLIPNCAYLGGLADRLQSELGVPVLANRDIALKMGELVSMFNLRKELDWVDATRSRRKVLLSTLYRQPVIGSLTYGLARFVKMVLPRNQGTSE